MCVILAESAARGGINVRLCVHQATAELESLKDSPFVMNERGASPANIGFVWQANPCIRKLVTVKHVKCFKDAE